MYTRRDFLREAAGTAAGLGLAPWFTGCANDDADETGVIVNDIHSRLNRTRVDRIVPVADEADLRKAIADARRDGRSVSVAGGRHAMGGQQFARDSVLIDTRPMSRRLTLDAERGHVEVDAGIQWPELIGRLIEMQKGQKRQWGVVQKQTGADRLTLGGAIGANAHGRGLTLRPIVGDVESVKVMDADGMLRTCSRTENPELFRLVVGGYGLFGIVTSVTLRLMPRTKLERVVEIADVDTLMPAVEKRIAEGYLYGDCQFSIDPSSYEFMKRGVFSCYRPLPADADMPREVAELGDADWRNLYSLAHTNPGQAYQSYASYYLATSGQRYWSDTHQLSVYVDEYHKEVDRRVNAVVEGSEMITEVYVPRPALGAFLAAVRTDFRQHRAQLIYGTIRLIEKDEDSFLAWAREPWVCTVMNLHVDHDRDGVSKASADFRRLIDRAIEFGGSYFLTYHRWARRDQVERCYPQIVEFLRLKRRYDPDEVFQSDWYRHYAQMFRDRL